MRLGNGGLIARILHTDQTLCALLVCERGDVCERVIGAVLPLAREEVFQHREIKAHRPPGPCAHGPAPGVGIEPVAQLQIDLLEPPALRLGGKRVHHRAAQLQNAVAPYPAVAEAAVSRAEKVRLLQDGLEPPQRQPPGLEHAGLQQLEQSRVGHVDPSSVRMALLYTLLPPLTRKTGPRPGKKSRQAAVWMKSNAAHSVIFRGGGLQSRRGCATIELSEDHRGQSL